MFFDVNHMCLYSDQCYDVSEIFGTHFETCFRKKELSGSKNLTETQC